MCVSICLNMVFVRLLGAIWTFLGPILVSVDFWDISGAGQTVGVFDQIYLGGSCSGWWAFCNKTPTLLSIFSL